MIFYSLIHSPDYWTQRKTKRRKERILCIHSMTILPDYWQTLMNPRIHEIQIYCALQFSVHKNAETWQGRHFHSPFGAAERLPSKLNNLVSICVVDLDRRSLDSSPIACPPLSRLMTPALRICPSLRQLVTKPV